MDHYIDIQIQPDDEMRENVLLNKVYSKLHKTLFSLKSNDIGVSFPEFRVKLGCTLRLHSTAARLTELQQLNWLGGLSGYCKITAIQSIPRQRHVSHRIQNTSHYDPSKTKPPNQTRHNHRRPREAIQGENVWSRTG